MRIGILSRNKEIYSTHRLVIAAEARGHQVRVIDPLKCYMSINARKPMIHYEGEDLTGLDALIPRVGASITFYGTAIVRQFEMMGVYCVNESQAITRSRDKLRSMQILAREGIGLPATGFAYSSETSQSVMSQLGEPPFVIKLLEGTQGKGVTIAESRQGAESIVDAFHDLDAYFLVQEFIAEAGGADIRCFVVGNKVIASMMRKAKKGEFRSNLHRGGKATPVKITPMERSTAVRAAKAMGLKVAGVDIIRSKRGPLVLEVNSSPGLEGIERSTKKDIAGLIIEYVEENAAAGKARAKETTA